MRSILTLALLLATASLAQATEIPEPTPVRTPVSEVAAPSGVRAPEMSLELVRVQETRTEAAEDASALQPQRGSFWWWVGAAVVAGVILAVVL